jgi:AbrB family looped-hinge helix DNA binding protein
MPLRKVRKFYQVSLPAHLSRKLEIAEGDYVEMVETPGGILVKPVVVAERVAAARPSPREQQLLTRRRKLIESTKTSSPPRAWRRKRRRWPPRLVWTTRSRPGGGLSLQKKEREAEADIKAGRISDPFDTAEEL